MYLSNKYNILNRNKLDAFFSILFLTVSTLTNPFVSFMFISRYYLLMGVLICFLLFCFIITYNRYFKIDFIQILFLLLMCYDFTRLMFINLYYNLGDDGLHTFSPIIMKYLLYIILCLFIKMKMRLFSYLLTMMIISISVASILLFICIFIYGKDLPHLEYYNEATLNVYRLYFLGGSNAFYSISGFDVIRVAGFCDEPGALALLLLYTIVLNELVFKKNQFRIILLICAFFTFSMAFFVTFSPVLIYWFLSKEFVFKKKKYLLYVVIVIISIVLLFSRYDFLYDIVYKLVFFRFEIGDNGVLNGDNRYIFSDIQKEAFFEYPFLGTPPLPSIREKYVLYAPTIYSFLAQNGILGMVSIIPFVYIFMLYYRKVEFLLMLSLIFNFLQRPGFAIIHVYFMILFYYIYIYKFKNSSHVKCYHSGI